MLRRALPGHAREAESLFDIVRRFRTELCDFVGSHCRSDQADAVVKAARAPALRHLGFWTP
eukprot:9618573-Alexandrium_andersonii.AAC.1